MKKCSFIVLVATLLLAACNQKQPAKPESAISPPETTRIFPKGTVIEGTNFTGTAFLKRLMTDSETFDVVVSDVIFEAGARNNWHSHPGGQILLATAGKGYYQEKGKPIQVLNPGDVVAITPNVVHWHGAAPDSEFTHIAINTKVSLGTTEWFEKVTDEEYNGSSRSEAAPQAKGLATKASAPSPSNGKILIAYFTSPETDGVDAVAGASRVIVDGNLMGNTEYVAQVIKEATGGDLFAIKTTHQYPGTHKELIDFAKNEIDTNARPKLSTHIDNLNEYDTVFIGFPNWWYDMPMPIYSFFDEYDFSGKTLIPFCTHGGSRFSKALQTIAELEKNAEVIKGHSVSRDNVGQSKPDVLKWLKSIGM